MGEIIITLVVTVAGILFALVAPKDRRGRLPAPRPFLPEGLPPGTAAARRSIPREVPAGRYVALVGRVVGPADLVAPMTRRTCVAFDLVVTDPATGERVARVLHAGSFVIECDDEQVTVDARGAYVRIQLEGRAEDVARDRFDDGVIPAHVAAGVFTTDEGIIAPGNEVLVIGVAERAAGADADYRSSADARLRISGGGKQPAVVSNVAEDVRGFEL